MPELPEVEVTRRGVDAALRGRRVLTCTVREPRLRWPVPDNLRSCEGYVLESTARRGKYLMLRFSHGIVVVHLGMSGCLRLCPPSHAWQKHEHVEWVFSPGPGAAADGGIALRLHDPRRFGSVDFLAPVPAGEDADTWWASYPRFQRMGPEPWTPGFSPQSFYAYCRERKISIKQVLLSGQAVVGVGNIYASESLFLAGVLPERQAASITRQESERIVTAVNTVLQEAIARGGSTLRDFAGTDGTLGHFQLFAKVYDRAGEPCLRCGKAFVQRIVQQQRSSFFCPACQC